MTAPALSHPVAWTLAIMADFATLWGDGMRGAQQEVEAVKTTAI